MSNTKQLFTAVQIRSNKVVQQIKVRADDFARLQQMAKMAPVSFWSIENENGEVVEVLK